MARAITAAIATAPVALVAPLPGGTAALALSEIQREELPSEPGEEAAGDEVIQGIPLPDPIVDPQDPAGAPARDVETVAPPQPEGAPPEVLYDPALLPEPVQRMRMRLIEAAVAADIEMLRPLLGSGPTATQISLGGLEGDPIAFLREMSGDGEGYEVLAILEEILKAGFVRLDPGEPGELYVWPYFFGLPLEGLTPRQQVELLKIVTAGDLEDMRAFGAYIFYRIGITPDGRWAFFVAGD